MFTLLYFLFLTLLPAVWAATAEQWKTRSIYQVITDRFALPQGADPNACDPGNQTWCGGTWNTIRENLDYIQNAGFTAVWISPINQNYVGPRTPYGDPYHGYWIQDLSQLNDRFGTADDLKALSAELHRRGMYLMVDVVVNNVMALSTTPDYSKYLFKDAKQYHPYCPVDFSNTTSEEICWLGDTKVPLPDLKTEDPTVQSTYASWIQQLVQEFSIDGLRIDAAKHVSRGFWGPFCEAAGVFCIGEVFTDSIDEAASYQSPKEMDSILNYPMYTALVDTFAIPGKRNASVLASMVDEYKTKFKNPKYLGNFLNNQDLPRWGGLSVDPQSMYNAMTWNFMSDGIPIVYYGQEQGFTGTGDPFNREPLWPSKYQNTTAYQIITTLNKLRNFLVNGTSSWVDQNAEVLTTSPYGIAIMKGEIVSVMTNIGSPPANVSIAVYTPFQNSVALTDVIGCSQYVVGSKGTVIVNYDKGGQAKVLVPSSSLANSGLCGNIQQAEQQTKGNLASSASRLSLVPVKLTSISAWSTMVVPIVVSMVFGLSGLVGSGL